MNVHSIAWLTDIHLNFLGHEKRKKFYQTIIESRPDSILITGDIAEAPSVCKLLTEFSTIVEKEIYFVLGNHDYYLGNVSDVRRDIQNLCKENKKLHWLGKPKIVKINNETILVGQDGWADARYGDFDESRITLNDSRYIGELSKAARLGRPMLKREMQDLADADAASLEKTIQKAINENNPKKILVATHIPPFKECCWYQGKQSDDNWVPYFSSKATGDVLRAAAITHPTIDFLILCGHTHTKRIVKPLSNLEVRVGGAEYFQFEIQELIELKALP